MKKAMQLIGVFALLLTVFAVGLKGTFDGYYGFYYEKTEYKKPWVYRAVENFVYAKPVNVFIAYTGFDTGYGFFAPNVASDFVLTFEIRDSSGAVVAQQAMPQFRQKESVVRFTSVFNMFLDKISKESAENGDEYLQYLDVVIRQIALSVKKDHPGAATVKARLFLYDFPTIAQYRAGDRAEKAILISEYDI